MDTIDDVCLNDRRREKNLLFFNSIPRIVCLLRDYFLFFVCGGGSRVWLPFTRSFGLEYEGHADVMVSK